MVIIMADETFIDLPNSPQQIGVLLTPANLRNIDFSSLDFDTARRAILEYIRTYFPNDFNDFVASNGIVMLTEIIASTVAKLSLRSDLLSNESTLPTCKTENALINHLALINQAIKVQTAASTSFEVAFIGSPLAIDISIPPGLILTTNGPDNKPVSYEVFKSPADNISNIVIPAGKLGVIAYGVEGTTVINDSIVTTGGANQIYTIVDSNVLINPLKVILKTGNIEDYYRPTTESVESYGPNDKVVEVRFYSDKIMLIFGDNIHGVAPGAGANISFTYRKGGGIRGRIGAGVIDATRSIFDDVSRVSTTIRFRNIVPSSGGSDRETIIEAKKRAPREYAVRNNLVTAEDYAQACLSFAHPTYGSIKKAVSALFSNINANQVRLYVLAEGYSSKPVTASLGLKLALKTYLEENNVLTDQVLIADGSIKLVDVEINVIVSRGADASTVKEKVESAITDFFDISKWDMGQPLFTSNLVKQLESIEGIAYIDLFKPANNILPNQQIIFSDATGDIDGIGINQLIAEGNRVTTYFYEKLSSTQSIT
jgi:hypothetical protein